MIKVGKPYLETLENCNVRLCSEIQIDEKKTVVWYEVEEQYSGFLCFETADAFLVGLLPYAMAFQHDIIICGVSVSEQLFWQLNQAFIPTLAKYSCNYYKQIQIECTLTNISFDSYGVGAGFSAGVDSFYTLLKNRKECTKNYNLTHLTFFNVGACGSYGGDEARERFYKRMNQFKDFVQSLGLPFVSVDSNISETLMMSFNVTHTFRSCSAVLALQKMFKTYYYSSAFTLDHFSLEPSDSAHYDPFSARCFSTKNTSFYSIGFEANRMEKVEYISGFSETYHILNVCNDHTLNCRTCEKCIRTMSALYAIKKIDYYNAVFDVDYFHRHLVRNLALVKAKSMDGTPAGELNKDILVTAKRNGVRIPFFSHLIAIPLSVKSILYGLLRQNKMLRRWWHRRINRTSGIQFGDMN